jgi:hypothetical protein
MCGGGSLPEIQATRGMRNNPVWKPPQNSQPDGRSGIFFGAPPTAQPARISRLQIGYKFFVQIDETKRLDS